MSFYTFNKNNIIKNHLIPLISLIPLSMFFISTSFSQQIEEIVVTAEKRVSSLQDTSISISVFSGEELNDLGITDSEQLSYYTPGLVIQRQVIGKVTMSGVGNENLTIGGDPSVALHLDGSYVARSSVANFDFFDVERIEVLRGPQGTLYGRNATGGAINVISNKPSEESEKILNMSFGNYSSTRLDGAISGPINDTTLGRISFLHAERDGYTKNIFPGAADRDLDELDTQDLTAVKAQLHFKPSDTLSIELMADSYKDSSNPVAYKYLMWPLPWMLPSYAPVPFPNGVHPDDIRTVSEGFEFHIPGSDRTLETAGEWNQNGLSAKITLDLESGNTFFSHTSMRDIDSMWLNDGDGIDVFLVNYFQRENSEQFTQEIRLSSADNNDLNWIVGGFYIKEDAETFIGIPLPLGLDLPLNLLIDGEHETTAHAFFGQLTKNINEKIRLNVGLRYNHENKKVKYQDDRFFVVSQVSGDETWNSFTPRIGIDYFMSDDSMLYANVSKGFKSGGFNLLAVQSAYDPEFVWSYEVGLKRTLNEGRLQTNLSAFYYDYTDMQVGRVENLQSILLNAAASTIKGAEIEVVALVNDNFRIHANAAFLNTNYDDFLTQDPGSPGVPIKQLAGNDLPRSPNMTGNIIGIYTVMLGNGSELILNGSFQKQGKQFFTQFNRESVSQDSFNLLNFNATYKPNNKFELSFYIHNITDEDYITDILESGVVTGQTVPQGVFGPPKTYGMKMSINF
jgi:iron complex outermembrane receptor protein